MAMSRFLKERERHFALLILSKWKISQNERELFYIVDSPQMGVS